VIRERLCPVEQEEDIVALVKLLDQDLVRENTLPLWTLESNNLELKLMVTVELVKLLALLPLMLNTLLL